MISFIKSFILILCFILNSCSFQTPFFKEINKQYINKNVIISPLSAYQILGLTANGANGKTLEQMLLTLGNKNIEEVNSMNVDILETSKDFTTIEIANAVMTSFIPKKEFLNAVLDYESTIESLKNVAQVNNWCNLKTHGKIEKILDELEPDTVMILLNAIYFKGIWRKEFPENETITNNFYNFNDESKLIKVDFMSNKEVFNYYEDKEMQIIELPYIQDSMSAIIILPNKDININDFISDLNEDKLQKYFKRMREDNIDLQLPKFEIEFSSLLNNVLKNMGMIDAFDEEKADLSGIKDENDIYIDKIIQKIYLKVDEKGTEETGITTEEIKTTSIIRHNYKMNVNRPFLFILRNKKLLTNYEMIFMAKIEELKNK